jgi:hypothetical protein
VGVRGTAPEAVVDVMRSVSETETKGAGAASEGRTGVEVCRFRGGVR